MENLIVLMLYLIGLCGVFAFMSFVGWLFGWED